MDFDEKPVSKLPLSSIPILKKFTFLKLNVKKVISFYVSHDVLPVTVQFRSWVIWPAPAVLPDWGTFLILIVSTLLIQKFSTYSFGILKSFFNFLKILAETRIKKVSNLALLLYYRISNSVCTRQVKKRLKCDVSVSSQIKNRCEPIRLLLPQKKPPWNPKWNKTNLIFNI